MPATMFPIRVRPAFAIPLLLFGVRPGQPVVTLGDGEAGELDIVFGWARFHTPMTNLREWRIEGPFSWITAIGIRLSIRHGDVTFGGSNHGGVRIDFQEPVRWSRLSVPAVYVSADDLAGLGAELARRGITGRDVRTHPRP